MLNAPVPFDLFLEAAVRAATFDGVLFPQAKSFVVTVVHEPGCTFPASPLCSCSPFIQAVYFPRRRGLAVFPQVTNVFPGEAETRTVYLFFKGGRDE